MKLLRIYLFAYLAAAVAMLGLDSIWLTLTADTLYRPILGDLMLDRFRLGPAIVFYALYLCGVLIFAVRPALAARRWTTALLFGALFGFFAYATYDLTNQATLKNWSSAISAADMAWGAILTGLTASVGYLAASRLARIS
ncbi:MAG TPA: DUF2177 family protein [Roseiarcus sp.]|nr:DUF2177 family protein [Roseiarcus sp.]